MGVFDRIRNAIMGLRGSSEPLVESPLDPDPPPPASGDGHAPGHRHLGPPPTQPKPTGADPKAPHDQPWVRTSQSDSQQRRPRG